MSEYLKMADVFCGNVSTNLIDDECINEMVNGDGAGNYHILQDDAYWMLIDKDHAEYAAHAINSHDALVSQRDELLGALERLHRSGCEIISIDDHQDQEDSATIESNFNDDLVFARSVIAKAKGGAA